VRTVDELDPLHISLLVTIGVKEDRNPRTAAAYGGAGLRMPDLQEHLKRQEIEARWPAAIDLFDPAIAALQRAGLIMGLTGEGYSGEVYGGTATSYVLLPYGQRFLDYLLIDDGGWPQTPAGAG
jgi:hypothetical protein